MAILVLQYIHNLFTLCFLLSFVVYNFVMTLQFAGGKLFPYFVYILTVYQHIPCDLVIFLYDF